jgi:hypothetical protein
MVRNAPKSAQKTGHKSAQESGRKIGEKTPKPLCELNFALARCPARVRA